MKFEHLQGSIVAMITPFHEDGSVNFEVLTDLLERQIAKAHELAGNKDLIIYIDPADEPLLQSLSLQNREAVKISAYSFSGGMRAVIPDSHILIDNSFETKLEEARRTFQFDLGGNGHE